jgi:hypothetical protein
MIVLVGHDFAIARNRSRANGAGARR